MATTKNRTLSPDFVKKLTEGKGQFKGVLPCLKKDHSLDMEMRRGKFEVYYRGAFLFEMEETGEYRFVNEIKEGSFVELIKEGKRIIDTAEKVTPELEISQLIVKENNRTKIAKTTDFFVIDREYQNTDRDQFDIVALNWDNDRQAHQHPEKANLVIIEVKNGTGSVKGEKGIRAHQEDFLKFLEKTDLDSFKKEMVEMFQQKCELELINISTDTKKYVSGLKISKIDYITLLANYSPRSFKKNLIPELKKLNQDSKFFISSFMGYALYSSCILDKKQLEEHIKCLLK